MDILSSCDVVIRGSSHCKRWINTSVLGEGGAQGNSMKSLSASDFPYQLSDIFFEFNSCAIPEVLILNVKTHFVLYKLLSGSGLVFL